MISKGYAQLASGHYFMDSKPLPVNLHDETLRTVQASWRAAQEKHGPLLPKRLNNGTLLPLLVEEVGEVAKALCDRESDEATASELYQVAAVAMAWAERLDERHAAAMRREVRAKAKAEKELAAARTTSAAATPTEGAA